MQKKIMAWENPAYTAACVALVSRASGFTVSFGASRTAAIRLDTMEIMVPKSWLNLSHDALLGTLLHEANGHGRRTSPSLLVRGTFQSSAHQALWNVLEDVRIERAVWCDWPGARRMLSATADSVAPLSLGALKRELAEKKLNKVNIGTYYTLGYGRSNVLGQVSFQQVAETSEKALVAAIGRKQVEAIKRIIDKTPTLPVDISGTEKTVAAAAEILALLRGVNNPSNTPGDDGDTDGEPGDEGDNVISTDLGDMLQDLLATKMQKAAPRLREHEKSGVNFGTQDERDEARGMVQTAFYGLSDSLREVTSRGRESFAQSGQRVNTKRAMMPARHGYNVFSSRTQGEEVNASVHVLLDGSGSMCSGFNMFAAVASTMTGRLRLSRYAAAAAVADELLAVCDEQNIPTTVATFGCGLAELDRPENSRLPLMLPVAGSGGTILEDALPTLIAKIALSGEQKKVVVIITDGDTYQPELCAELMMSSLMTESNIHFYVVQIAGSTTLSIKAKGPHIRFAAANCFESLCTEIKRSVQDLLLPSPMDAGVF